MHFRFFDDLVGLAQSYFYLEGGLKPFPDLMTRKSLDTTKSYLKIFTKLMDLSTVNTLAGVSRIRVSRIP